MRKIDEWKKIVVEHFVAGMGMVQTYRSIKESTLFAWMDLYETKEIFKAFESLIEDKFILKTKGTEEIFYMLDNFEKVSDIRNIVRREPFTDRAGKIKPEKDKFKGLIELFNASTERAWPNRGIYYYCVKENNPYHWTILIKTKPTVGTITTMNLGSLLDKKSKISNMWKTIVKVWIKNKKEPIYKKLAGNANQIDFSNNRQPSTAGFTIFVSLGWLKEVGKKSNSYFYMVQDENAHEKYLKKFLGQDMPICPNCGQPTPNNFCFTCNQHIGF